MCGITGFISRSLERQNLETATVCLQHRGPDAGDVYFNKADNFNIGLGHRRLAIIDLSPAGNQPMYSSCGRYVMVYNGEVYNYNDIRTTKFTDHKWKSGSDTEVILESFAKYGSESFQWLNGIFALAIWDIQEQTLTLARDHVGVKPLFYYFTEDELVFASELKAIKAVKKELKINYSIIPSFLHLGYIIHPHSIYKGVEKLTAGSWVQYSFAGNKLQIEAENVFWKIQDHINDSVVKNEQEAKQQLNGLLCDAVQKQLVSDVPIGTFLSGGTDSSLVTALATKVSDTRVKTFSIAITDGKINEAPFAAEVAKHLNTEHYELPITQKEILDMIPGFLNVYDEPFCDSSAFPTMMVSKLARKYVTVTLSGDGGDELFFGYGSYLWAKRLNSTISKMAAPLLYQGSQLMSSRYKRIGKLFANHPSSHFQSHLFSQDHYFFTENEIHDLLINKDFNFSSFNYSFSGRKLDIIEQTSFWDIENYLKDNLLVKVDRASMRYALETRVPLLDHRVIEFALNLDPHLKINKDGTMKYLLKEVLYDYVPKTLLDRPKWGFGVPLVKWLKADLKWLVDKYCSKEVVESLNIVEYRKVEKIVTKYYSGKNDFLYNRVWALTVLHWFLYEQTN